MANLGTVIAHLVKLFVTVICMRYFNDSFSLRVIEESWAVRAFQILLVHSLLGILRFGGSSTTKRLRNFYELFSSIAEVVPAAFFTTEILLKYGLREELRILLLALGLAPTAIEISSARIKDRSKLQRFTNAIYTVQSVALLLICEQHGNYGGMSLAASLGLMRFFSEDFCDQYEVPYTDLSQYSLSFIGFFGLVALKNL